MTWVGPAHEKMPQPGEAEFLSPQQAVATTLRWFRFGGELASFLEDFGFPELCKLSRASTERALGARGRPGCRSSVPGTQLCMSVSAPLRAQREDDRPSSVGLVGGSRVWGTLCLRSRERVGRSFTCIAGVSHSGPVRCCCGTISAVE